MAGYYFVHCVSLFIRYKLCLAALLLILDLLFCALHVEWHCTALLVSITLKCGQWTVQRMLKPLINLTNMDRDGD